MTLNISQAKQILDNHLGSSVQHRKDGEISYNCPFCNHHKPKLQVNLNTQKWHCWICDSKGQTMNSLLKKSNATSAAQHKMRELYGDKSSFNSRDNTRELVGLPSDYKPLHIKQNTPAYKNALHYIINTRQLTPLDVLRYQIGYCEDGPYAGMIIIPNYDNNNMLNYYVGRSFYGDAGTKHKNPPVSKDVIGFENQINWKQPIIIVEGAYDAITTKRNAIPLFGKLISNNLKNKICTEMCDVYLALDSDVIKTAIKHIEYFLNHHINVFLVNIPGKDPNEIGFNGMVEAVKKAKKIDFLELLKLKMAFSC
jgi:DNA primase